MAYKDKAQQAAYCRAWYQKHKVKHDEQNRVRRKRGQEVLLAAKAAGCAFCGELEPVCLDFHHLNPAEKDFQLGGNDGLSVQKLVSEIAKCAVVCANCHRKLHAGLLSF